MKVSACFSAAVFGSAAFAAVNPISMIARQVDVITGILTKVGNSIDATDSAAKAYDGSNAQPVLDAGKSLVSTINDGVSTATNSKDLDLASALGLQQPVNDLTSKAQTLVNDLTDKRSTIAKNGQCANTREVVGQINDSSNKLINAIVAKVPQDAQSIADMLVAKLKAVLAQAQDNFSTANCVDAVVASSAAASSAAAPTSAAAASSAAGAASSAAPAASSAAPAASSAAGAASSAAHAASSAGAAPTKPAGGATPTGSAVKPPAGTPTGPATVPTAGAGSLIAPGVFAIGVAVALL